MALRDSIPPGARRLLANMLWHSVSIVIGAATMGGIAWWRGFDLVTSNELAPLVVKVDRLEKQLGCGSTTPEEKSTICRRTQDLETARAACVEMIGLEIMDRTALQAAHEAAIKAGEPKRRQLIKDAAEEAATDAITKWPEWCCVNRGPRAASDLLIKVLRKQR